MCTRSILKKKQYCFINLHYGYKVSMYIDSLYELRNK